MRHRFLSSTSRVVRGEGEGGEGVGIKSGMNMVPVLLMTHVNIGPSRRKENTTTRILMVRSLMFVSKALKIIKTKTQAPLELINLSRDTHRPIGGPSRVEPSRAEPATGRSGRRD